MGGKLLKRGKKCVILPQDGIYASCFGSFCGVRFGSGRIADVISGSLSVFRKKHVPTGKCYLFFLTFAGTQSALLRL